jgi:hypothetical protein
MIQVDDLSDVSQRRVGGLIDRVVEAGAAMQEQQGRLFRMTGPSGTSFAPSTSKNGRTPLTSTCMAKSPCEQVSGEVVSDPVGQAA